MRVWIFALLPFLSGVACGGGDSSTPSEGEKACNALAAKASQCMLIAQCDTNNPCQANCAAKAECAQLTAPPAGSYLSCVAACIHLTPDQVFVCKDSSAILDKRLVCDGTPECPDHSDESNCGNSRDAGKD
jgi:hypothetical protein